jgi:rhodanese-related sulfurtransferase
MATGLKELLQAARSRTREIDAGSAAERLGAELPGGPDGALFLDVRESEELAGGRIPGSLHIPRGLIEPKAAADSPARDPAFANLERPLVIYCASGVRSILAADSLQNLGFSDVTSLAGGFAAWKAGGHPIE